MGTETGTEGNLAQAGIEQAKAEANAQPAPEPAKSDAGGAAKPAPENPFASEDAELAKLIADEAAGRSKTPGQGTEQGGSGDGGGAAQDAGAAAVTGQEAATEGAAKAGHDAATAAIVALRKRNQELQGALLIKEGENRVLKSMVDKSGAPTAEAGETGAKPPPQSPEEELHGLAAERIRIAEEVDAGRMTMREYAEKSNEIQAREFGIAQEQTTRIVQQASASPRNDLALEDHASQLTQKYPILNSLSVAQLEPFERIAYEQAELEGKPIQAGPVGTRDLRERMASLAQEFYGRFAAAAAKGTPSGSPNPDTGARERPTAQERENKLALAGNHPPNIGAVGSGATGGAPTDAQAAAALMQGEDAAIRWMEQNPGFVASQMRGRAVR